MALGSNAHAVYGLYKAWGTRSPRGGRQQRGGAFIQRRSEKTSLAQEGQRALWAPEGRTFQQGLRLQGGMPGVFQEQEGGQWGWGREWKGGEKPLP